MKKLAVVLGLLLVAFAAGAGVTATFTNPVDYSSDNWRSVCIYNRDTPEGDYRGEIVWEPRDFGTGTKSVALSTTRSTTTLPAAYQTFVNVWIGFARADFPAFN